MENKYYLPKIEELHVGFEYWLKSKEPTSTKRAPIVIKSFSDVQDAVRHFAFDDIVVKYLSKEDIESFGFIKNDFNAQLIYTDFFNMDRNRVKNKCPYRLYADYNEHRIMIKYPLSDGQVMFDGIINNKSEFKKLLNQLNIINE